MAAQQDRPNRRSGPIEGDHRFGSESGPRSVAEITTLPREDLLKLWHQCFGSPAPKGISLTFLRRFLAFERQAQAQGGLPAPLLAKLARIDTGQDRAPTPALKSGGRLLREWNGITHVVDVTPEGYLWQGKHYRSLSVIARTITGAHWSGPRFFGLTHAEGGMRKPNAPAQGRKTAGAPT